MQSILNLGTIKKGCQAMVVHTFSLSTWGSDRQISGGSRPAWSIKLISGQSRLHRETLYLQKEKGKRKRRQEGEKRKKEKRKKGRKKKNEEKERDFFLEGLRLLLVTSLYYNFYVGVFNWELIILMTL